MSANNKTLLLVDNDEFIVEELTEFLQFHGFSCNGVCSPAEAIERFAADPSIALVLTDLNMPGMNGIELIQELQRRAGASRLFEAILFTGQSEKEHVIAALRTGFADYYQKPLDLDELLAGVKRQLERLEKRYRERDFGELDQRLLSLASSLEELRQNMNQYRAAPYTPPPVERQPAHEPPFDKLSPRQLEVVALIARGMTNYNIACELGISENTVKLYVSQILRATNIANRTQLALAYAPGRD